jgi:DNA-binding CsgD family transcriptional regulator/type II secretory pathway predicted ATPase ExeA
MAITTQLGSIDSDQLLDRRRHLNELAGCWQAVQQGQGHLVLLSGEAGAGKTALLRNFWGELDPSTRVLWSACDSLSTPRPLGPLLDIGRATEGALKEQLDSGGQPYDVADALVIELDSLLSPAVLVVEDVHWADDATLDVLRILARRVESLPALLLFSFREEELGRFHPLRALIGNAAGQRHLTRIDATPLTRASVASLASGSRLDADELHALTGGNAFFVTEILGARAEGLPSTVRDAVLARASGLSADARSLLDAAAIVAGSTEQWLLESLADVPLGALEGCISAGMLRLERDGVAFRHELARIAIEESIPPDVRLALHRRALRALGDPPGGERDLARLAYHAEAAADTAAVLEFAPAAAREAASIGAHTEAQEQYGRALRFAGGLDAELRAELLESFADESYLTDMREGALDAISEAIAIRAASGDAIRHGRDLVKRSALLSCLARHLDARIDAEAAVGVLESAEPAADLAVASGYLCFSMMVEDRLEDARSLGERGVALAEALGDEEALGRTLGHLGAVQLSTGDDAGRVTLERALSLALEADDGPRAGAVYISLTCWLSVWAKYVDADRYFEEGVAYCRARGLDAWEQVLLVNGLCSELSKGEWDRAGDTATGLLAGSPEWHAVVREGAILGLGQLRARRGDPDVWSLLNEARDAALASEDLMTIAEVACARAEARWLEGDTAGVAAETDEIFAQALAAGRDRYAGELACWRRRAGLSYEIPAGALEQHRLQLRGEGERSAALWTAARCPYDAALALLDSGRVKAWRESLDLLTGLGARPAAAVVSRRLREAGERGLPRGPRAQTLENPMGLTGRQLEVLGLLAQGMRNGEIADRLVLSRKTVDHHVSAILGKLNVRTRHEATVKALAMGLESS